MNFKVMRQTYKVVLAVSVLAVAASQPVCHAAEGIENQESKSVQAQEPSPSPRNLEGPTTAKWSFGSEIDALPFVSKGYYGSGFVGHNGWRFRDVVARSTVPSFMVSDGFKDKRTDAYALLADRFVGAKRQKLEGLWVGGGAEYWRNRIRTEDTTAYANYHDFMLTAGAGYVWKFSKHFYLNPWVAGHVAIAGERSILVSGKTYKQPVFTPEGSIKLGFTF
jgi:hypothetical protein